MRDTLVIGDFHSHVTRLESLLVQEGLLDFTRDGLPCRLRRNEVEVVLLGDVGHFGGAPRADLMAWGLADEVADVILWGNHDRAVVDSFHAFSGYRFDPSFTHALLPMWRRMIKEGRLLLAHEAHGFLLTHAGLHLAIKDLTDVPESAKLDPKGFADWVNQGTGFDELPEERAVCGIRDAISRHRGGPSSLGGILWRDIDEKLYTPTPLDPQGFRQVFGHSADHKSHAVRKVARKGFTRDLETSSETHPSYCVDVGGRSEYDADHCIAGIYLPSEEVVRWDANIA